jgi:ketose-bisphosphate aldolase
MLEETRAGHYAVGAFNFCNAETLQAVVEQVMKLRSPVMLILSPGECRLLGAKSVVQLVKLVESEADVPVCLHLDHAASLAEIEECIAAGFPSVMIDGSSHDFEENIRLTRAVVEMAHPKGITVEGELGALGRADDITVEGKGESSLTDPERAAEFIRRTGVNALAVSIGNAHGIYSRLPQFDFERLAAIREAVDAPLVLHGGSGTSPEHLRRAIELGITKVNVASEIDRAYKGTICEAALRERKVWYVETLIEAKAAVAEIVRRWMRQLGCAGKA